MRLIAPLLAVKVDGRIARIIGRRFLFVVLGLKALKAGPSFDQRTVNGEMLVAGQPFGAGQRDDLREKLQRNRTL